MSCDIHWHSETKRNGQWECDQADSFSIDTEEDPPYKDLKDFPNQYRDYWFFGLIQPGVRTEWSWSFPERIKIPDDLSKEVKEIFEQLDSDGHSHGWITRAEIKAKLEELKQLCAVRLLASENTYRALTHHAQRLEECLQHMTSDVPDTDQRIVFCFDN